MAKQTAQRLGLAILGAALLAIVVTGLLYLSGSAAGSVSVALAYAAGLSMIFLPCTLPLVFIIVPLTVGKSPAKGLMMALLFGLGVSITLALYGVLTATIGSFLGLDSATRIMFTIAGVAALLFGLSELELVSFSVPGFSGSVPTWIENQKDYLRVFFMGIFLGNAGVGCPNPAFYVLLTYIAQVGSVGTGAWLGFVHGLGRATPLVLFAILGILGFSATSWVSQAKDKIDRTMGWALVTVGAFILTYGVFGMAWWENSLFHAGWNQLMHNLSPALAEDPTHPVAEGLLVGPFWAGWTLFFGSITAILAVAWYKSKLTGRWLVGLAATLVLLIGLSVAGITKVEHRHGVDDTHEQVYREKSDEHSNHNHTHQQ